MVVLDVQTTLSEYVLMKQTRAKALIRFHHTHSPHVVLSSRSTSQYGLPINCYLINMDELSKFLHI